ncbi:lysophosphatidic acid receptor 2b isoform X1 [Silurus meridionalis]|uniref:lysophosphatidic acid receptor 2b isoform X1 n=1 Tax=Silurus meridionalis TaxID=175797 RepID=UPI001EEC5F80|nr:lysophosphatidic acid receptor 2b isoform X1 [Silurus meridionalis]XP_046693114.1 lysophosphatidic acid receptor 2b isoform X1 [Silurus meridionalis]XP_046693115.1 lysophosphatidic acid receptor 2b isoform X1 [Silurus meridionalis]XP_046693116.1 lysophosphatidic acid receptor 2b isoform X1 [Silurus meridionalis]
MAAVTVATTASAKTCNFSVAYYYNMSGKVISDVWQPKDYAVVSLGLIVCFFVIATNILVMTAIFINRRFHYPIYYLLGNLAAADLFAGIAYLHLMFHTGPWTAKLSVYQWFLRQGLIDTSLTASVINLMAIALERHQTIFTMQLHSTMTNMRVILLIVGIWTIAVLMGLIPSMGWNCLCHTDNCSKMAPMYSRSYLVFWAVLNLLSFSVMVLVYTRIFIYVRHKSQRMSQHTVQNKHKETVENLMRTVFVILGCFVVCWTPGLVLLLLDGVKCNCGVLKVEKFCLVLAELNSMMNPIIYSYRDQDMRRTFKHILCCLCRRGRQTGNRADVRFNTLNQEVNRNGEDDAGENPTVLLQSSRKIKNSTKS